MAPVLPAYVRSRCRQTSGELPVLLNSGESSYVLPAGSSLNSPDAFDRVSDHASMIIR